MKNHMAQVHFSLQPSARSWSHWKQWQNSWRTVQVITSQLSIFFSLRKLLFLLLYLTRLFKLWVFSHPDLIWIMSDREVGRQIQKCGKWQSWNQHIQEINIIGRYSAKAGYSSWVKMGNVKLSWQGHVDSSSWKRHILAHTIVSKNRCLPWENTDVCNFFDFFFFFWLLKWNNLVVLKNSSRTWYCKCYFCTNCKLLIQTKHTITYRTVLKCILIIKMHLKIDWCYWILKKSFKLDKMQLVITIIKRLQSDLFLVCKCPRLHHLFQNFLCRNHTHEYWKNILILLF